jgi:hypothetical protein
MAGLVPAIQPFFRRLTKDVDARDKRGHDEGEGGYDPQPGSVNRQNDSRSGGR